jgi:uncharacterized membrane protein
MYIKRYTIGALVLMVLVGWYTYAFVTQESIGIDLFGIYLPKLPIAFLVVVPILLLYIASVVHMFYYSVKGSFKLRKYQKDYERLVDAVSDAYLGKPDRHHTFRTERYTLFGHLIDNSTIVPGEGLDAVGDEKIDKTLEIIQRLKAGESVELKKLNLSSDNPLVVQNDFNRYANGELSDEEIMNKSSLYSDALCLKAYSHFVATAPLYAIEKYKSHMNKEALYTVLARVNAEEQTLEASNDALIELMSGVELDEEDYIAASSILANHMVPDQRIKLFELLSETNETVMPAYLYTLFDLEMLEPANEILDNSQPEEFENFKAYRALKECNKNFKIDLFLPQTRS